MISEAASIRLALTTIGSIDDGRKLARLLVDRRLVACVNLIPNLTSVYRWNDAVEEEAEVLMVMKTTAVKLPALEAAVRELHSYEIPEFLALDVASASQSYLKWLHESVAS
jgi:periplasmic divalent cation tolerance protein